MTVEYTAEVATCRGFGNFHKLLIRWRGSIYKVLWAEIIVYLLCFYSINLLYRFYLEKDCDKKKFFIALVRYCDSYGKDIPISFVLGFYVSIVVSRWWNQFMYLPWPDTTALTVSCTVEGNDDRGRLIRRTIMRYCNLAFVFVITMVSAQAKLRFPTLNHLVEAGPLQEHERVILEDLGTKTQHPKHWVPIVWAGTVARRARKEGKIKDDISLNNVIVALNKFRHGCQEMLNYDWVNVPLVYTQVVTLAVYLYFLAAMVGKQLTVIKDDEEPVDFYFPFFSFLEFFFYFGWLKVAECLINPYGSDDDDFEVNWMIDRYFQVSYIIVDEMHSEHPNLLKDQYWDEVFPVELPYTQAAEKFKSTEGQTGSTKYVEVPPEKAEFIKPTEQEEEKKTTTATKAESPTGVSMDSLKDAFKSINSTARARVNSRGRDSGVGIVTSVGAVGKASGVSIGSNRRRAGNSGVWGKNSGQDVKDLMEKDHPAYDPTADDNITQDEKEENPEGEKKEEEKK